MQIDQYVEKKRKGKSKTYSSWFEFCLTLVNQVSCLQGRIPYDKYLREPS